MNQTPSSTRSSMVFKVISVIPRYPKNNTSSQSINGYHDSMTLPPLSWRACEPPLPGGHAGASLRAWRDHVESPPGRASMGKIPWENPWENRGKKKTAEVKPF